MAILAYNVEDNKSISTSISERELYGASEVKVFVIFLIVDLEWIFCLLHYLLEIKSLVTLNSQIEKKDQTWTSNCCSETNRCNT